MADFAQSSSAPLQPSWNQPPAQDGLNGGQNHTNDNAGESAQNQESAPKKRDRWSKAPDNSEPTEGDAAKNSEADSNKKKSRWGAKQPDPVPPTTGLALVPFGTTVVNSPGLSLVPFGASNPAMAAAQNAQVNPVNPEQLKIQLRIAEIQNLYSRPRFVIANCGQYHESN
jgi:hypothetical protein